MLEAVTAFLNFIFYFLIELLLPLIFKDGKYLPPFLEVGTSTFMSIIVCHACRDFSYF